MRNRPGFAGALFVLALLVQILAPLGAAVAMSAAFDARQLGTVCIQVNEDGSSSDQTPQAPHAHDDCCGLCQLVNGPPAVLHPALIGLSNPPALYRLIIRDVAGATPASLFVREQHRARAPPTLS